MNTLPYPKGRRIQKILENRVMMRISAEQNRLLRTVGC